MNKLIIVGGGEHANCVYEAATLSGRDVTGFLDIVDRSPSFAPYLGPDPKAYDYPDAQLVLGIGLTSVSPYRKNLLKNMPPRWATVIHPSAIISPSAEIGRGTVVMAGAIVNARARVGEHCIVNSGAIVEHDCTIGDFTHLCPGVTLGGGVRVGENCFIGLGSSVRNHIDISPCTFIPMHSCVKATYVKTMAA